MRGRVLAAALLVVGIARLTAASGQEGKLFGYELGAQSDGISILYDQPSFGVPAKPTFEVRNFHGATALNSGPSAHALASVLWPGDVVGNAPPSLALEVLVFDPTANGSLTPVISALDLFAGTPAHVHIDQVFSSASSTSDGTQGKLAGTVAISGMTIGGQAIVVDDKGLHLGGQNLDPAGEL